jgi:hypothetical protein
VTDVYACGIEMHRPTGDLFAILGVEPDWTPTSIIAEFGPRYESLTTDQKYAYQALSNEMYRQVYDNYGTTDALYAAGFFLEDPYVPYLQVKVSDIATLPMGKVQNNLTPEKPMIVLVTTGGFAPIHKGHLEMMEQAKLDAESKGFAVVGGYFVPGHDSYVGQKYNGTAAIPAPDRIAMCEIATEGSDWLAVDSYCAIHMPGETNFTFPLMRIERALKRKFFCINPIKVGYVYGSDNAGFGLVMGPYGFEVSRSDLSSKAVREGNLDYLPAKVADYYREIGQKREELPYLIRSEGLEAFDHWTDKVPSSTLESRLAKFQSTLRFSIKSLLGSAGIKLKVHVMDVTKQREKGYEALAGRKSISLDAFFNGTYQLSSSRMFEYGGDQAKAIGRCARPGSESLIDQASKIEPGDYVLVEDDTVTGQTIRDAKAILPVGVNIVDQVILSDFTDFPGEDYYDVVDLRDFILGAKHGGLCIKLGASQVARLPYVAPFVNLRTRAKIPASELFDLNRVIWQCNVDFFKDTGLTIMDLSPEQRYGLESVGIGVNSNELLQTVAERFLTLFPINGMAQ